MLVASGSRERDACIQVNDLGDESRNNENEQNVKEPLVELGRSPNLRYHGRTEALRSHHAEASDKTTDGQVDQHALLPVPGPDPEGNEEAADDDHARIAEEAGRDDEVLHLLDGGRGGLGRRVHDDDDGADDAQEAAHLADHAEPLLEEDGGQDGGDDDRQGAERRHQDGVDEGVGHEVADLADDHERHARPPEGVLEVPVALAGRLVVLLVGLQQADLLQHEGDADEQPRGDG